jgi:hypothetical protein
MFRARRCSTLRAIVACTAAYVLALNVILAGVLGASALTSNNAGLGNPPICLSHSGSDEGAPTQPASSDSHCILCLAGLDAPVLTERATIAEPIVAAGVIVAKHHDPAILSPVARDPSKPPTGPPHKT